MDVELTAEAITDVLRDLRDRLRESALAVSVPSGNYKAGSGGWWELNGYADVVSDAIDRITHHRCRVESIDRQIARERANGQES